MCGTRDTAQKANRSSDVSYTRRVNEYTACGRELRSYRWYEAYTARVYVNITHSTKYTSWYTLAYFTNLNMFMFK